MTNLRKMQHKTLRSLPMDDCESSLEEMTTQVGNLGDDFSEKDAAQIYI